MGTQTHQNVHSPDTSASWEKSEKKSLKNLETASAQSEKNALTAGTLSPKTKRHLTKRLLRKSLLSTEPKWKSTRRQNPTETSQPQKKQRKSGKSQRTRTHPNAP